MGSRTQIGYERQTIRNRDWVSSSIPHDCEFDTLRTNDKNNNMTRFVYTALWTIYGAGVTLSLRLLPPVCVCT